MIETLEPVQWIKTRKQKRNPIVDDELKTIPKFTQAVTSRTTHLLSTSLSTHKDSECSDTYLTSTSRSTRDYKRSSVPETKNRQEVENPRGN